MIQVFGQYNGSVLLCSQGQDDQLAPSRQGKRARSSLMTVRLCSSEFRRIGCRFCIEVNPFDPNAEPVALLDNFRGRAFNSLNDVIHHKASDCLFVTDPTYGFQQNVKRKPQLPNAVWSFSLADHSVRMLADDLKMPNGIVCSPDEKTCYITDTDFIHGDGSMDGSRAGTM